MSTTQSLRQGMIQEQIIERGITNHELLKAFESVPREFFVADDLKLFAYEDHSLPISEGQTISQPYIVALMIENLLLKKTDKVLEVGTGSGYSAALLSHLADQIDTIDIYKDLSDEAKSRFEALEIKNINVFTGDGSLGLEGRAPYDAIIVAAGAPSVPKSLLRQLKAGGRLVIPCGFTVDAQDLYVVHKTASDQYRFENLCPVNFVPLVGAEGWKD